MHMASTVHTLTTTVQSTSVTNTTSAANSSNAHISSTTPTCTTNTIVTSTRHTHTTQTGNIPPHASLTTTAPAQTSNQTQADTTSGAAATEDMNDDRGEFF